MVQEWGEPFLLADWVDVLMIHLEVEPAPLQRSTPFALDLFDGRAFVSRVAFTMRRMRPRLGGRWAAWCFRPIATHPFFNVRTYVRHENQVGIHFLAEWVPNRWSLRLGPQSFGLPYRLGRLDYGHRFGGEPGEFAGSVIDGPSGTGFRYRTGRVQGEFGPCEAGSLESWLMERYTAFTHCRGVSRYFRVWHPPWRRTRLDVELVDQTLLTTHWPCLQGAEVVGASGSPGFEDVWMGRPRRGKR